MAILYTFPCTHRGTKTLLGVCKQRFLFCFVLLGRLIHVDKWTELWSTSRSDARTSKKNFSHHWVCPSLLPLLLTSEATVLHLTSQLDIRSHSTHSHLHYEQNSAVQKTLQSFGICNFVLLFFFFSAVQPSLSINKYTNCIHI